MPRMKQHMNADQPVEKFPPVILHSNQYTPLHRIFA
jgi:hypothetical protein